MLLLVFHPHLADFARLRPRYTGVFLAASGIFPSIANILPWVANNQGNDDRRGVAFVMLNFIGQVGPILGTRMYPTSQAPYCKSRSTFQLLLKPHIHMC